MNKLTGIFVILIFASGAFAAFDYPAYSPAGAALGNSYMASEQFASSFLLNPALSAYSRFYTASLNYFQLFNMPELGYAGGTITIPFRNFGIGAAAETFGGSLYRESRFTLNVAHLRRNNRFALGLSASFYSISAKNYPAAAAVGVSVGVQYELRTNFRIAGAVENINQPRLNGHSEEIPQRIRLGFQYNPAPGIETFVTVEKDAYFDPDLLLGVAAHPAALLKIYSGFSLQSSLPSGGIALQIGRLNINYALQYHFDLGTTHFIGISINPGF